jgi:hypothetical protein
VPCKICGSLRIAFYDPKVLTTGEAIRPQDGSDDRQSCDKAINKYEKSPQLSTNEKFLESLIKSRYEAPRGNRANVLEVSKHTTYRISKKFNQTVTSWKRLNGLPPVDPKSLSGQSISSFISLRPCKTDDKSSLLGFTWKKVQKILEHDYPELKKVAIGISIDPNTSVSAHLGEEDEKAIVIDLGLFGMLPRLNHLLSLIFDTDMLLHPGKIPGWTIDDIMANVISVIMSVPVEPSRAKTIPNLAYENEAEFIRAHDIKDAQLIFIILHELGHFVHWQTHNSTDHKQIRNPQERSADIEAWSDKWAMELIFKRGAKFHQPWLQYRSIFWLFEYWHILNLKGHHTGRVINSKPRYRWDHIAEVIKSKEGTKNLGDLCANEFREIINLNVDQFL